MCHHYRIPHSTFLGWSEMDQALAVAFGEHQRIVAVETCPTCGTRDCDWREDGHDLTQPAWDVEVVECAGCRRRAAAYAELRDAGDTEGRAVVFRRHVDAWDDDDGPEVADRVVVRWEPDTERARQDGEARGLVEGCEDAALLDEFAEKWAPDGWVVVYDGPTPRPAASDR